MSEPRWTVDEDGDPMWGTPDVAIDFLTVIDMRDGCQFRDAETSHAALAAAIRDADTLRQAREAAIDLVNVQRSYSFGIATAETVGMVQQRLLDLLAPPDTGAEP